MPITCCLLALIHTASNAANHVSVKLACSEIKCIN